MGMGRRRADGGATGAHRPSGGGALWADRGHHRRTAAPRGHYAACAPPLPAAICSTTPYDRAAHSYGKSYRDVVRAFRRQYPNPPDVVAFPCDENDIIALLDWCSSNRAAAIPYGGGSSVGGGEPPHSDAYRAAVSIDLRTLSRVVEIDRTSSNSGLPAR